MVLVKLRETGTTSNDNKAEVEEMYTKQCTQVTVQLIINKVTHKECNGNGKSLKCNEQQNHA